MKTKAIEVERHTADAIAAAKAIIVGILSFIFGGATIFSAISPFGVAFVACLPIKYAITASVGTIISVFLFTQTSYTGFYVTAILLVLGVRLCIAKVTKLKIKPAFLSVIAITAMSFCAIFYNFVNKVSMVDLLLMCIEV